MRPRRGKRQEQRAPSIPSQRDASTELAAGKGAGDEDKRLLCLSDSVPHFALLHSLFPAVGRMEGSCSSPPCLFLPLFQPGSTARGVGTAPLTAGAGPGLSHRVTRGQDAPGTRRRRRRQGRVPASRWMSQSEPFPGGAEQRLEDINI